MADMAFSAVFWKEHFGVEAEVIFELLVQDDDFAEICRDFLEIRALKEESDTEDAHLEESLAGLKSEIETRLSQKTAMKTKTLIQSTHD